MDNQFLALLSQDDTSGTPREIVHLPERVQRQEEGECWDGKDVEQHPADHVPFTAEDEDQCLETVDCGKHDQGPHWDRLVFNDDEIDQINQLSKSVSTLRVRR